MSTVTDDERPTPWRVALAFAFVVGWVGCAVVQEVMRLVFRVIG